MRISDMIYSIKREITPWFNKEKRRKYVEDFGWYQLFYDFTTLFLSFVATLVWVVLFVPAVSIYLISLGLSKLIELSATSFSRMFNRTWFKRAYFKTVVRDSKRKGE